MKFIHISNVHIGLSPDPDKFWSNERANDIKNTFANVIKKCDEGDIDLLLISGNLFNHQPLTSELDFVNSLFKTIMKTKIIIVAGSSDYIKQSSPILNYKFSDNVHYVLSSTEEVVAIKSSNVVIHAFSYYSHEEKSSIIDSITPDAHDGFTHILLCYGGDSKHAPFDLNALSQKNFSYVALGLTNEFHELAENKIYYPGSLEAIDPNDETEHGFIYGEINEETGDVFNINFVKIAESTYIPIKIKVNAKTTEDEIVSLVTREVLKLGNNNMFKIEIDGMRNPDLDFSENMFSKKIRIASFTDNSTPKYDFIKLSSEHPNDMIGAFIRKMTLNNREPSEIEKKALYYGTQALLKSTLKEN